jgi:hypothetical protein
MSLIPFGFWAASGGGAAGGFDLLETTTLSTSASSVTFSGLGAYSDYKHLQVRAVSKATTGFQILTFNGDSGSGNTYTTHLLQGNGSSVFSSAEVGVTYGILNHSSKTDWSANVIDILDAFSTDKFTTVRSFGGVASGSSIVQFISGAWYNTAAITSLTISKSALEIGSRFSLYGVK